MRQDHVLDDELRALGTIVTLEGHEAAYPLKLDSLQSLTQHRDSTKKRPKWLLLSVLPGASGTSTPERAVVWVSDDYRPEFLKRFDDYLHHETKTGKPRHEELVANIGRIRATILDDLWQSKGSPPQHKIVWWEVWLRKSEDGPTLLRQFAKSWDLTVSPRLLRLLDRDVMWIQASWARLAPLPFTAVPLAEIRQPEFIDSVEDLGTEEQIDYVEDLVSRLEPAGDLQPAVCHLDTGVARTHQLLRESFRPEDLHTVIGTSGFDSQGHGTKMAGLALYGAHLEEVLLATSPVRLQHRLESVRLLPNEDEKDHDPVAYGDVTAQAVSLPEIASARPRVFCMPISTSPDASALGEPTLWSSTVDALAAGVEVVRNGNELLVLSAPDPAAARLFVIAAGNTKKLSLEHLDESDTSAVVDPGQAWNALTVGAYTDLTRTPTDVAFAGWEPLAEQGELSPHSRTSLLFGPRPWPVKPDVVMEGGNVLHDGAGMFDAERPTLNLRTTGHTNDQSLTSANATSAATAQVSRLAALVMATYPHYWPETVRALIVHGAEWTPPMRRAIDNARKSSLQSQQRMLRRYGWGVPTEDNVLYSSNQAVTLIVQDEFAPFEGKDLKIPHLRLHDLPWPRETLQQMGGAEVKLRVTISYFVEPAASRRGWRRRYSYASHGLRFEMQDPLETETDFIDRVNRAARTEDGGGRPQGGRVDWLVGVNQRNYGSLHQDVWETSAGGLADTGKIAVYPVGGWWKNNVRRDRMDQPVRYSLVVSLKTSETDVDLYSPVSTLLAGSVEVSERTEIEV
ncbi:S8 family peptidase [Nesterenkonia sp. CF4.4]|uniref:S8 family peptidase n=1 Tax=Nesterenkonia sp. CF4.4 TaxID=3373079 RepID=UPI003EE52753